MANIRTLGQELIMNCESYKKLMTQAPSKRVDQDVFIRYNSHVGRSARHIVDSIHDFNADNVTLRYKQQSASIWTIAQEEHARTCLSQAVDQPNDAIVVRSINYHETMQ